MNTPLNEIGNLKLTTNGLVGGAEADGGGFSQWLANNLFLRGRLKDKTLRQIMDSYGEAIVDPSVTSTIQTEQDKNRLLKSLVYRDDAYSDLFKNIAGDTSLGAPKGSNIRRGWKSSIDLNTARQIQTEALATATNDYNAIKDIVSINFYGSPLGKNILKNLQSQQTSPNIAAESNRAEGLYASAQLAKYLVELTGASAEAITAGAKADLSEMLANSSQSQYRRSGGPIYASSGTLVNFQPKGTDTVPAMLTPGEFVVNRDATQKHLSVLKAINSGEYSAGGVVSYLRSGGMVFPNYYQEGAKVGPNNSQPTFDISAFINRIIGQFTSKITTTLERAINRLQPQTNNDVGVSTSIENAVSSIDQFVSRLDRISATLRDLDIPQEIKISGKHEVNVIINGDAALNSLKPDLADLVTSGIKNAFNQFRANNPAYQDTMNFDVNP